MPIIDMQRRMVEAGRIRAGEKGSKGEPRKLDKWRLTSHDEVRLRAAAKLWGGGVREWAERPGEFELYTDVDELAIIVGPETQASLWYELYSAGGPQRRCDGVTEMLSDSPCMCDEEKRQCKPSLRFSVMLPDLPGLGSWLVVSHGFNAAREIPGTLHALAQLTAQGVLVPARLRLEQRKDVKEGQTRKYAVPVIDIDVSFRQLLGLTAGGLPAGSTPSPLPAGYTPIAPSEGNGTSLEAGLKAAETQTLTRKPRVELPEDDVFGDETAGEPSNATESAASGPPDAGGVVDDAGGSSSPAAQLKPTPGQKKKIGVLLSKLRDEEQIVTTEQIWANFAKARDRDVDFMILGLGGRDEEGVLHFGPLLADLTRPEAARLIDWFERYEANVGA